MAEDNKEVATEQPQEQNKVENTNGDQPKVENGEQLTNGTTTNGTTEEPQPAEPVKEMRSIVVNNFGGLKSVKVIKKPEPAQPAEDEVLIRVQSAGLSFNDLLCRQGSLQNLPKPPFSLGFEAAGLVESVGSNVDLKVGYRVACLSNTQCWSELVLVNSKYVYKLPEDIDYDNAVALTLNYVLAHYLLFEVSNLKSGQSILIQSCAGGVGLALVQLASTVENVTIIGTASKAKHEKIEGVAHLFDHSDDYVTEIKKLFPEGINIVLSPSDSDLNKCYGLLKPLGSYNLYGSSNSNNGGLINSAKFWLQTEKIRPLKLFEENKTISGFNLRHFLYLQNGHDHVREIVDKVYNLFLSRKVNPIIDSRFAFEDVSDAMLRLQDRKNIGKIILDVNLQPKPKPVEEEQPVKKNRLSAKFLRRSDKNKEEKKEDDKKEEEVKAEEQVENGEKIVENTEKVQTNGEKAVVEATA